MTLDLSKLSSAPWAAKFIEDAGAWYVLNANGNPVGMPERDDATGEAFARFAALARNAFDVMMWRGWYAALSSESGGPVVWYVYGRNGYKWNPLGGPGFFASADPFTALVEADRWYKENVEDAGGK